MSVPLNRRSACGLLANSLWLAPALSAAGIAGAVAAPAGPPTKLTIMTGVGGGAPSVSIYWIGKEAGFYKDENIDADVIGVPNGNVAQGVQLVAAGQADGVLTSIESVIVPASQGKDTGLVFVYNFFQRPNWRLLVRDDGSVTGAAQLKGKTVGLFAPGNPSEPLLNAFLAEAGVAPGDVKRQVVGLDLPAAQALQNGSVDAVLTVSLVSAVWETVGFHFRQLPPPAAFASLIGPSLAVPRETLKNPAKRDAIVRFLRNWAQSAVFVKANPEAAIKIDFDLFPQAKPRNVSAADAIKTGVRIQNDVLTDYTNKVNGKWGAFQPDAFKTYIAFLGLQDKLPDLSSLWTNELIDDVNTFDEAAVIAKAKAFN